MRQLIPILLCTLLLSLGCSPKYGIQKSYGFARIITAGNIPVDDQNRPLTKGVQKTHLVYLEMKDTTEPRWDTAWIENKAYLVQPLKITTDQLTVGKTRNTQETILITPTISNSLWQLLLTPLANVIPSVDVKEKMQENAIVLLGTWKNKPAVFAIKEETELERIYGE